MNFKLGYIDWKIINITANKIHHILWGANNVVINMPKLIHVNKESTSKNPLLFFSWLFTLSLLVYQDCIEQCEKNSHRSSI